MDLAHRRFQAAMLGVTLVAFIAPVIAADVPKPVSPPPDNKGVKPLKVFILAGQSNMQGHASLSTFDSMAENPKTALLLKEMRRPDGKPRVCDKVWITSVGCAGDGWSDVIEQKGKLTAGFGASTDKIGPEFTFGLALEKQLGGPILIIKTAWGGRSLHTDFRPPSAGPEKMNDFIVSQWKRRKLDVDKETAQIQKRGSVFYRHMIEHVQKVLKDVKRVVPDYDPKQGYELAGFVWFQGFNDMIDDWTYHNRMKPGGYDQYAELLAHLIRDVRKDLSAPKMPFVIGVMGIGGVQEGKKALSSISGRPRPRSIAPRVQGQRGGGGDGTFLGRRTGRAPAADGETRGEAGGGSQEGSEAESGGEGRGSQEGYRRAFHAKGDETPEGHLQRGLPLSRCRQVMAPIGEAFAKAMYKLLTKPPQERKESETAKPAAHTERNLEGWRVRVDDRLLKEPSDELGKRALRFLENKLADIKAVVPADKVKQLQKVTIVLDLSHGKLTSMQYHPSAAGSRTTATRPTWRGASTSREPPTCRRSATSTSSRG